MNIGIVGAGNLGSGLAKRLAARGHAVMLSFSKSQAKLDAVVATVPGARGGSPLDAIRFGDVVVLATPWGATLDALAPLRDAAIGKTIWDCTNALKDDLSGLVLGTTTSGGEEVAKALPGALVVKAIPPFAEVLHADDVTLDGERIGVFVCGDDEAARRRVSALVDDIGARPFDAGPLVNARYTEPAGFLLVRLAYGQGYGARIGFTLLRETT